MSTKTAYLKARAHGHPKSDAAGQIAAHIVVAERALGRHMPTGSHVHHVNSDGRDNTPGNLVICQDNEYHRLLHMRARIVANGGNPDDDRMCYMCGEPKPLDMFYPQPALPNRGVTGRCKPCQKARDRARNSNAVYVGRPTMWGNPFVVGQHGVRGECVTLYRNWFVEESDLYKYLGAIEGRDLVCWCAPAACHADFLLEIANP